MKKSRFTESQIVAIHKQHESGVLRGSRLLVHCLRDWACFHALLSHVFQRG